jgi:hypothetical protein
MTTQQQTDLQNWKIDRSQPLPASLDNVLIEDCLEEMKKWNILVKYDVLGLFPTKNFCFLPGDCCLFKQDLTFKSEKEQYIKVAFIQTLLSRTPDGQAVMPFLDVELDEEELEELCFRLDLPPFYLIAIHLLDFLSLVFGWLQHNGKTFDEAYKITNLIYCQNA